MKLRGRFAKGLHPQALRFSSSLEVDRRLYDEDIQGSIAHVNMLARQRIISSQDARKIGNVLTGIRREIRAGRLLLPGRKGNANRLAADDIHMAIERLVMKRVGEAGGRMHTARSRNDQVALDERLFLRDRVRHLLKLTARLQRTLVGKAEQYEDVIMPGYTHLQRAQPILLAHHLLAYVSMLGRDRERLSDCLRRVNRSPLGAVALAGTSLPIDRNYVAAILHFDRLIDNSIDAVSDRDVHIEFLACCSILMMHLSRLAEELVLWSSREWQFVEIHDSFSTGSSIMPQKKNPDIVELVRGKTGRVYGDLMALLTVMKGLPLAYNRDMQEDKQPLFDAADTAADCLVILSSVLRSVKFYGHRFEKDLVSDPIVATELADYLVRKGLPFRKAHGIVGGIVRSSLRKNIPLSQLSVKEYRQYSRLFGEDVTTLLDTRASLSRKKSSGSTSPKHVRRAIRSWKKALEGM